MKTFVVYYSFLYIKSTVNSITSNSLSRVEVFILIELTSTLFTGNVVKEIDYFLYKKKK